MDVKLSEAMSFLEEAVDRMEHGHGSKTVEYAKDQLANAFDIIDSLPGVANGLKQKARRLRVEIQNWNVNHFDTGNKDFYISSINNYMDMIRRTFRGKAGSL